MDKDQLRRTGCVTNEKTKKNLSMEFSFFGINFKLRPVPHFLCPNKEPSAHFQ